MRPFGQSRRREIGADAVDLGLRQGQRFVSVIGEFRLHLGANGVGAFLMHQDLDARPIFIVAAAFEIIDPQNRVGIGEEIGLRQEVADLMRDQGGAPEAAANIDEKPVSPFSPLTIW